MTSTEISVGDYSEDYDDICDDYPDQLYNPLSAHLYKSSPSSSKGTFVGTGTYCGFEPNSFPILQVNIPNIYVQFVFFFLTRNWK
jgi:hypothetical protein